MRNEAGNAVRLGLGPTLFPPGYEFTTHDEDTRNDIVWAVRAHDHHTPANSRLTHSMTLEAKYVYSYANGLQKGIQFDAAEALYFAEQGLAAGTYNFTWSFATGSMENGTYQFTLNHALPVNGQIVFNAGSSAMPITDFTIATYGSVGGTEAVESNIAVTQGTGGTALGTISLQGSINENLNCAQRILWGSGNYAQSAMRQWLNSSAAALGVWAPTNRFDRPAAWAASYNGFMYGLDADFLAVVERAVIPCRTNSVFEVESLDGTKFTVNQVYELRDKFFLLSRPEIYGSWDSTSCKDGELLEYYEGLTNAECIKRDASGAERIARLRGPHPGITSYGHVVDITGVLTGRHSHLGLGVAPACIIA